jgi:TPR repeat protein
VPRDAEQAERYFRLACEGGHENACDRVAGAASPGIRERAALSRQRCEAGDALGCVILGYLHQRGLGVPAAPRRALALFERACRAGEATGCRFLATMVQRGEGVRADAARAARLQRKACDLDRIVCAEATP